jgi:hypothetical protein
MISELATSGGRMTAEHCIFNRTQGNQKTAVVGSTKECVCGGWLAYRYGGSNGDRDRGGAGRTVLTP